MHQVATERNELKDENTTLQAEISQLQKELQGRSRSNPTWSDNINSMTPTQPQPTAKGLTMLQHFSGGKKKHSTTNAAWAPSQVMRPHARCPTSSDLQPGLLLWTSHQDHKNRDVAAVALALAARRKDVLKHQLVYHYNQEMYIANPINFFPHLLMIKMKNVTDALQEFMNINMMLPKAKR